MSILTGDRLNEFGEVIVPEHPLLTVIKKDSRENRFGQGSVYEKMHTKEMKDSVDVMEEFGAVMSAAIFNGNHSAPMEAVAKLEGLAYKDEMRQWYPLLVESENEISHNSLRILDGMFNYNLLAYHDSVDHDTYIQVSGDKLYISNYFTDRFSFNLLGRQCLRNILNNKAGYHSLILCPLETQAFMNQAVEYIYDRISDKPEAPHFQETMGACIKELVDSGTFNCSNIVLVADDILVLVFDKSAPVDYEALTAHFEIIFDNYPYSDNSDESGTAQMNLF